MTSRPPSRRGASLITGKGRRRDPSAVAVARRRFLCEGILPGAEIAPEIVRSWQRSGAFGLDMASRPNIEALSHRQLREVQEQNEALVRAARGEIEALYHDARTTGGIVILTDPHGVVLATVGNIDFAERASRVSLRPGVDWNEATIGTNAIGTAIAERREIAVHGSEHFFESHEILGCSAVPILSPSGAVVGVLDLSNDAAVAQTHTLALVKRAVEQIERRLFEGCFAGHEQLHFHADPSLVDSSHEGLLAFDDARLVGANRQALDLLGLDWSALGLLRFDEIFSSGRDSLSSVRSIEQSGLRTLRGSTLFARLQPSRGAAAPPHPTDRPHPAGAEGVTLPAFDARVSRLLERAVRLADADLSILIHGEVGTGKEIFARRLHAASRRREGPFVVVDCSATSEEAIAASLFGPPGEASPGVADGGTLLLEAVDALPASLQTRLEHTLKTRARGDGDGIRTRGDFALISTTHARLSERVAANAFLPDLLVRIAAYTVDLAPVREHPDRRALIGEMWGLTAPAAVRALLPEETLEGLAAYDWPGNHRQLVATLRALAVLAEAGEGIGLDALPQEIRAVREARAPEPAVGLDVEVGLDTITLAAMRNALEAEGGNVSRAARRLGIHRSTLYRRVFGADHSKA